MRNIRRSWIFLLAFSIGAPLLAGSVKLSWTANPEGDLAGYHVYRSNRSDAGFQRIDNARVLSPLYIDRDAVAGQSYFYRLTAENSLGLESDFSDVVQAKASSQVSSPGENPVADAGSDRTVASGSMVSLLGGGFDPDGGPLAFSWMQIDGPSVLLRQSEAARIEFQAPRLNEQTVLRFRLAALDDEGAWSADEVTIVVQANRAPIIEPMSPMEVDPGRWIDLAPHVSDPDGDQISYQWTQLAGPSAKAGVGDEPVASFQVPSEGGQLIFRLIADDGLASAEERFVILGQDQSLLIPADLRAEGVFVGAAFVNPSAEANLVDFTEFDREGGLVSQLETQVLAPGAQRTLLLNADNLSDGAAGLKVRSQNGVPLHSFFMIGDGHRLDGIGGRLRSASDLYFPFAQQLEDVRTRLFVYHSAGPADPLAEFSLYDAEGQRVRHVYWPIAAGGAVIGTLDEIFGEGTEIEDGWVEVRSSAILRGFEFHESGGDFFASRTLETSSAATLWAPQFVVGSDGTDTFIRLHNRSEEYSFAIVRIYGVEGLPLSETEVQLVPGHVRNISLADLLRNDGLDLDAVRSGHVEIDLGGQEPQVVGTVVFSGGPEGFTSMLPLLSEGRSESLFLQVAQSKEVGMFTGFAILNATDKSTSLTVEAYDADGHVSGRRTLTLGAGQRVVDLLDGEAFFGSGFEQVGGHVRVTSDQPVLTFALFGDYQSHYLAAIEGQAPAE